MTLFAALRMPREILFGKGQRAALGVSARRLGSRALVCTDARLAGEPVFAELVESLHGAGLAVRVDDGVLPDVPRDSVKISADAARSFEPDLVIGIGGGSCLDMAKCVALLLRHGGGPQDYYGEYKVPGPVLPLIAMPTTAGTGSEVTPVAVLSDPDRVMKVGISSPHLIPQVAICDPDLTLTCPRSLSAIAGADAMTHAIEAFMAVRREPNAALAQERVFIGKSALTDHYALLAIRLLSKSLERVCTDGGDEDARADVMMGALAAGLAFGTAGTSIAHAVQYAVGALTHTAHGVGVACLMPYVMSFNTATSVTELAEIGRAMGLTAPSEETLAEGAIAGVAGLFERIGIPPTLRAMNMPEEKLAWTAEQALGVDRLIKNNPRPIDLAAMHRLVAAAFQGDRRAAR